MLTYLFWVYAGTALLLLVEIVAGRHKGAYARGDIPLLMGSILGRQFIAPLAGVAVAALYAVLLPASRGALADVSFWIAFPVLLLFSEFVFYWFHRAAHENKRSATMPMLWKLHRTHHSGKHMNVALTFRVNVFWYLIFPTAWTLGLGVYLGQPEAAAAVSIVTTAWNSITHSNFRWDDAVRRHRLAGPVFRALEHVVVSPRLHHTHHGYGRDGAGYRNFGTVLSVWDWLFGTLHIPEGRPWRYGNPGPTAHWLEELLYPVVNFRGEAGSANRQTQAAE